MGAVPAADDLPILYADEHLLVVAKPPRCLVVAAPGRSGPTLVDRVGRQLGERIHAVHRLDEDTTGVIVLARTADAKPRLEELFRQHGARRIYLALAARVPSPAAGRIESSLAVGADGVVRSVRGGRGERAVTTYRTLARRGRGALLECELETGRRNQIRAHLAELGCPLVGDRKYGWRRGDRDPGPPPARPLLHAWRIEFDHPWTGARVVVECAPDEPELRP
jgi:23S rRNA pseudouridine1911/1915/1917 synthase